MVEKGRAPRQHGSRVCNPNHHARCLYLGTLLTLFFLLIPCPLILNSNPTLDWGMRNPKPPSLGWAASSTQLNTQCHPGRRPHVPPCPTSQPGLGRALCQMDRGLVGMSPGLCIPEEQGQCCLVHHTVSPAWGCITLCTCVLNEWLVDWGCSSWAPQVSLST